MKTCTKCGIDKEANVDNFPERKRKSGTYALRAICRTCANIKRSTYPRSTYRHQSQAAPEVMKLRQYRRADTIRGHVCNLTEEFVKESLNQQCVYCTHKATGLDRKDNTKGHTIENCVPCCKECNTSRMDNFTHIEMFELGKAIKQIKDRRLG